MSALSWSLPNIFLPHCLKYCMTSMIDKEMSNYPNTWRQRNLCFLPCQACDPQSFLCYHSQASLFILHTAFKKRTILWLFSLVSLLQRPSKRILFPLRSLCLNDLKGGLLSSSVGTSNTAVWRTFRNFTSSDSNPELLNLH